ncbi:MAG: hypothetical protein AAGF47_07200 [Planctomycetota bacterium]
MGDVPEGSITDELRTLAAMRDPVADAYAGWLVAVLAAARGVTIDRVSNGGGGRLWTLTPGGRAWLIATAIDLIDNGGVVDGAQLELHRAWCHDRSRA